MRVIDDIDRLGYIYGMKVWFDDDDELPHRKQKPAIVRAHPFTKMSIERSLYKCSESPKTAFRIKFRINLSLLYEPIVIQY